MEGYGGGERLDAFNPTPSEKELLKDLRSSYTSRSGPAYQTPESAPGPQGKRSSSTAENLFGAAGEGTPHPRKLEPVGGDGDEDEDEGEDDEEDEDEDDDEDDDEDEDDDIFDVGEDHLSVRNISTSSDFDYMNSSSARESNPKRRKFRILRSVSHSVAHTLTLSHSHTLTHLFTQGLYTET